MAKKKIGVLVGSLRRDSYSKKIAEHVAGLLAGEFEVEFVDIGGLEMYNQDFDLDNKVPESWQALRDQIFALDGFLFVTPEYNRSVPAVLKNALDVASRDVRKPFDGKPGAVVSVSPGALSAFGANHHLRQSAVFLNILMMQQPEAYIGNVVSVLDENGKVVNEGTDGFLKLIADSFIAWVNKF
ncbi:MAG: NAD(P)H-dependent oxidoreductase [Lactobacillales bacterium]|jgi:chromate reductase|nr:NAD(P)H-dependent oxidoreductase [Lactobacillales bacterium]